MARRRPKLSREDELQAHLKIVTGLLETIEAAALLYPDLPNFRYAADEIGRAHKSIRKRLDDHATFTSARPQTEQESEG